MITNEKIGLGGESRFDFKYVPTLTRTTRLGQRRTAKFERPGVEVLARLGLLAAFCGVLTLALGLVFAARIMPANQLLRMIRV